MYKQALTPSLLFLSLISIFTIQSQPVKAIEITLTNGEHSALYDDNSNSNYFGFNDWDVDGQKLLTETGLFYRVGNSGTAQTFDTLTSSSNVNGNSATATYTGAGFTIDLELSLDNISSTLDQTVTVNNTSGSSLDFALYSYFDLVASNGNGGDAVEINGSDYTATQSGDLHTIITTVTENPGNNTTLTARRAEVDVIDLSDDTLLQKLLLLSDSSLQLDNALGSVFHPDNAVSFAYEWNYNLGANGSFAVNTSSSINSVAVPFEFSPSLGILLSGIFGVICYFKLKLKTQ